MLSRPTFRSWCNWYVYEYPHAQPNLPHGYTIRASNTDFTFNEATYLIARLIAGNHLSSLHFNRDSGICIASLPDGTQICVYVRVLFTARVGDCQIALELPPDPEAFSADRRVRTSDRRIFTRIQNASVAL